MTVAPTHSNTAGILIAYNPGDDFPAIVDAACENVSSLFVVNNGEELPRDQLPGIELIDVPGNIGQAAALNIGCTAAAEAGFHWLLLLDQDTLLSSGYLHHFRQPVATEGERIGLIGGNPQSATVGEVRYRGHERYFERDTVQMSGSLIRAADFRGWGEFRTEFFIDSVDADYCLRSRSKGRSNFIVAQAGMRHSVGETTRVVSLMGRRIPVTNHGPDRCYRMARNGLTLVTEYWRSEPVWCIEKVVWYLLVKPSLVLLFEDDRQRKIRALFRGARDAFRPARSSGLLPA